MIKHTPGPWFATQLDSYLKVNNHWIINAASPHVNGKSQLICTLNGPWSAKNYKANAHLIAAAPELLKALHDLVGTVTRHRWHVNLDEPDTIDAARKLMERIK